MKLKRAIFTVLIGSIGLGFIGCNKMSQAIPPAPTSSFMMKGAEGPPVFVVDNVIVSDLKQHKVGPSDIKSINVLKPGSGDDLVSTYGVNAKNGVILITTKAVK